MTGFRFEHPRVLLFGLLLLPLLAGALWQSRAEMGAAGKWVAMGLRAAWMSACLLAMALPVFSWAKREPIATRVYVLEDASQSVAEDAAHALKLRNDLREAMGAGPEIVELQFASRSWKSNEAPADRSQTDIAAALNLVNLQSLDIPDVKVVLLSDGRETRGDAVQAANRLALRGGAVYTMPIGIHKASDTHIVRTAPPEDARVGIAAGARVTLQSEKTVTAQVQLADSEGHIVDQRSLQIRGQATLVLHFTPKKKGIEMYSVRVDLLAGSSRAIADTRALPVFVKGPPRLLVSDNFPDETAALCKAIEPLNVPIDVVAPERWPDDLTPYAAVVLSDWSGKELTVGQRHAVRRFVEEQGGGLVFIAGGNVLPATWKVNELAELLPLKLRDDPANLLRQLPDASVVYVVDRSGSMNEVLGGANPVSKMDMVKAAIIASVQALPEKTQVGVISFDDRPEILVSPTDVSKKDEISREVATLAARGGTVIEPAIRQGMAMLATMPGRKYLVVLTDGIGERPSSDLAYWGAVADDAKKMHLSWTSVAVGADADQTLLSFLAKETHGEFFFCDTGDKIPQVFLHQALAIKKVQKQQEKPFYPAAGPAAWKLKDILIEQMPLLNGRVRASPRDRVDILLKAEDDEPVLASWQFGLGKVVAFSSDAKAGWGKDWVNWKGFSPFWVQTVQDVMRAIPALHAKVTMHVRAGNAIFHFAVTDEDGHPADNLQTSGQMFEDGSSSAAGAVSTQNSVEWKQTGPGEYDATVSVPPDLKSRLVSLSLQQDAARHTEYCAMVSGDSDPEMAETGPDMKALSSIAEAGNGLCTVDPETVSARCRTMREREITQRSPLWRALVVAALAFFPLDVAGRKFLR